MMTLRENVMAVMEGRQPDYYGDFMPAIQFMPDPYFLNSRTPQDGEEHKDPWGTVFIFKPGAPGAHPHVTKENCVISDIEKWQEQLHVPSNENLDWEPAKQAADATDRKEKFVGLFCNAGLFERSHHLMGMEEALVNYMEYPDEMTDLLTVIKDWKIDYIQKCAKEFHPDIIFYHDDWGHKYSMFLPPRIWRAIIKPLQQEISDCIHDCGMIYMHHADCYCQPIVEDMVELGIDVWQGTIAQNDIPEIQRITKGKLPMIGGIDGPKIDIEGLPEEDIRAEVRRAIDEYCPGGPFFPSIPNGVCYIKRNNDIFMDELKKYGRQWAIDHPVK